VSALRRHDDIGDVLAALVLVAAAMGAFLTVVFLNHFPEQGAIFGLVTMSPPAGFTGLSVQPVLSSFPTNVSAVASTRVSGL